MRSTLWTCTGAALLLSGCWWAPGQGPSRQAYNPLEDVITVAGVAAFEEAWSADLSDEPLGPPVVATNGLVVAVSDHSVHGVDRLDGELAWGNEFGTTAAVYDTQLVVVGDGRLVFGFGADNIFWARDYLDEDTGERVSHQVASPAGKVRGVRGDIGAVVNTAISNGVRRHILGLIDLTDPSGQYPTAVQSLGRIGDDEPEPGVTLGSQAVLHAGPGVLSTVPGDGYGLGVRAFAVSGTSSGCGPGAAYACPSWVTPVDGAAATAPVLSDDEATVFVATDAGTVYALDATDGTVVWTGAVGAPVADSPALDGTTLFVPTTGGALVALPAAGCGAATCDPLWSTGTGSPLTVQPAVGGGVVFTGAVDGTVAAYDAGGCGAATCTALWSATTGSEITGAPAISGGHVYVGSADGRLTAYA